MNVRIRNALPISSYNVTETKSMLSKKKNIIKLIYTDINNL